MKRDQALYLKNSAVALLMVVPLVLLGIELSAEQRRAEQERRSHEQPPIIEIAETAHYRFRTGSAEVDSAFAAFLSDTMAGEIAQLLRRYDCNIVEVVGHTDGQVVSMKSTTDRSLFALAHGDNTLAVSPGSNADLGLMRAWSVVRVLQPAIGRYSRAPIFLGYSAGQLIGQDYRLADANDFSDRPERRRIEIRLRRSSVVLRPSR